MQKRSPNDKCKISSLSVNSSNKKVKEKIDSVLAALPSKDSRLEHHGHDKLGYPRGGKVEEPKIIWEKYLKKEY